MAREVSIGVWCDLTRVQSIGLGDEIQENKVVPAKPPKMAPIATLPTRVSREVSLLPVRPAAIAEPSVAPIMALISFVISNRIGHDFPL